MNTPALLPDQLPSLDRCAELARRYAHLLQHFSSELGERPLVRQSGEFFPDRFDKDAPSVERLVRRLQAHAGMVDVPIQVRVLAIDSEGSVQVSGGSCGSGGCAPSCAAPSGANGSPSRLEETAQGWTLNVLEGELHHPVALTTQLSLALAEIFLAETSSAQSPVEQPHAVSRDLACVALGLGLIALEGSYIYGKSCGGPSVTRLTELSVGELAVACSLFIALGGHSARRARSDLSTTQRALLGEASEWAQSNTRLLARLLDDPGQVASRPPEVREARSWLLRVFDGQPKVTTRRAAASKGRQQATLEQALASGLADHELLELAREQANLGSNRASGNGATGSGAASSTPSSNGASRAPRRTREHEELAALVDEALRG
ncbi:MAG: hypothetical protein RL685_2574 [Pseudomonadota bacterium]|jgi:hypothetical protein